MNARTRLALWRAASNASNARRASGNASRRHVPARRRNRSLEQTAMLGRVQSIADPVRTVRSDGRNERERSTRDSDHQEPAEDAHRRFRAAFGLEGRDFRVHRGGAELAALLRNGAELHVLVAPILARRARTDWWLLERDRRRRCVAFEVHFAVIRPPARRANHGIRAGGLGRDLWTARNRRRERRLAEHIRLERIDLGCARSGGRRA